MDEKEKAIIEQAEGVMTEAYKDLVSPSVKPIGQILSFLPRTIRLGLSKWEKWIINGEESLRLTAEALREKVLLILEEKQCEPEPYIAVPAIQQISYCYNSNELRELYANLLATSMNLDKKGDVHPSFVGIIQQLTPDEAKLISKLPKTSDQNLPLIDISLVNSSNGGGYIQTRNIINPIYYEICENQENMSRYIENMIRLQLIEIPSYKYLSNDNLYNDILESELVKTIQERKAPDGYEYKIDKKSFHVTDFGAGFIRCCIDE